MFLATDLISKEEENSQDLQEICENWFEDIGALDLLSISIQRNDINLLTDYLRRYTTRRTIVEKKLVEASGTDNPP